MAKVSEKSAIPIMTSNTSPSGIASASSMYSSTYDAWKAFDEKSLSTMWQSANNSLPSWIAYEFETPKQIVGYKLIARNITYSPKDWVFEGSNDSVNWVKLDEQVNVGDWVLDESKDFYFLNNTSYKKYRLYITSNNHSSIQFIYLQSLQMFEMEYDNKFLFKSESGEVNGFVKGNENIYSDNLIPKMTSATVPSGVVSANNYYSSYQPYNAFDNIDSGTGWLINSAKSPMWLSYEFPSPKVIAKYTLVIASLDRAPKDWTFEGSMDGVSWTVLDIRDNVKDWVTLIEKEFTFKNKTPYLKYRININQNNGNLTYTQITEMKMMELLVPKLVTYPKALYTSLNDQDFINHGLDDISFINPKELIQHKGYISNQSGTLGSGRLFENKIDLNKYKTKKITFQ